MKTALITGASSGIGLELAKIFANNKYNLVLVARDSEKLNKIKTELQAKHNISVLLISKDLSLKDSPRQIFEELQKQSVQIDVLVNNAGFGEYGKFVELDLQKQLNMISLNVLALTELTHLFLREMVSRKSGKIIHSCISTRPAFSGLLCDQGFCAFFF